MNMRHPGMADTSDAAPRRRRGTRAQLKKDWNKPVERIFFNPGVDAGLALLCEPEWMWRPVRKGRISGAAAASYDHINQQIDAHIETHKSRRAFKSAIEFNTMTALIEDVSFDSSAMAVRGRWFLSGAGGTRLRHRFYWKNLDDRPDFDEKLDAHFARVRDKCPDRLPVMAAPAQPLDLVLDCRNFFNFYHFLTETLPQLCAIDDIPSLGRVRIHSASGDVRDFIRGWVDALFPELLGRVEYVESPATYERALSVLNTRHLYHQCNDAMMPDLDHLAPNSVHWAGRRAIRNSQAVLAMNAFDANLRRLRERALRLIAGMDTSHLPRRFWVGRDVQGKRDRSMKGEAKLVSALEARGFERVYFERLSPLEQVALMANAEVMMSYHGAGFANMIFAGPDTHCIELGTLQTALYRWGDFMPHAHVSGCRYTSLFCDFHQDDPSEIPALRSGNLVPVALGPKGMDLALNLVDAIAADPAPMPDDQMRTVAALLNQAEDWAALRALLIAHPAIVSSDPDYLIMQGNCAEDAGDHEAAFDSLEKAWRLSMNRPFLLERLILLADQIGAGRAFRDLRDEHQERYGHRHQDFLKRMRRIRRKRETQEAP